MTLQSRFARSTEKYPGNPTHSITSRSPFSESTTVSVDRVTQCCFLLVLDRRYAPLLMTKLCNAVLSSTTVQCTKHFPTQEKILQFAAYQHRLQPALNQKGRLGFACTHQCLAKAPCATSSKNVTIFWSHTTKKTAPRSGMIVLVVVIIDSYSHVCQIARLPQPILFSRRLRRMKRFCR